MARALLIRPIVLVEVIYRYRALLGRCELGFGLDWDDMEQVASIERAFAPGPEEQKSGRRFHRERVHIDALVRGDRIHDAVTIVEIGPGGLVCAHAPFIARGEEIEIVVDDEHCSYRFRAQGVWLKDDGEDYTVGLAFVGMPVCLHRARISRHDIDLVDKIVAAAA